MRIFLTFFFLANFCYAQDNSCQLYGTITDEEGKPIPYTSIFITSIAQGTMANLEGDYSISLPCHTYELQVQSMGYQSQKIKVNLSQQQEVNIRLKTAIYELNEVVVDPNSEDPAYNIIRKATAMAEYYKKQINAYKTTLYVRSFFDVESLPWIAKKLADEDDLAEMQTGDIEETILEYSFRKPNQVKEKILARKTGRFDTLKTGSSYINLNFYNLGGSGMINPLSRGAFAVYQFEYQNTFFEETQKVHKIRVIPKRNGSDLMRGYIYINDGLWNINKVDVSFEQPLAKIKYEQIYNAVEELVWMPINHKLEVTVSIMGFDMEVQYLATLKDLSVEADSIINQAIKQNLNIQTSNHLDTSQASQTEKVENNKSKRQSKIEELIQKEELTKKETIKLVKMIKQEAESMENDSEKESLEIKDNREIVYADDAFEQNDSAWNQFRQVPLSEKEKKIYVARDSLNKVQSGDTIVNEKRSAIGNILFFNGTLRRKSKFFNYRPNGLLKGIEPSFNTVDGFLIEKELFDIEYNNLKGSFLKVAPWVSYSTARDQWMGRIDISNQYNYKKRAGFYASIGRKTTDFNGNQAINKYTNSISSLFFRENFAKLYQEDFGLIGHQIDLVNGLVFNIKAKYSNRKALRNNTNQAWFNFLDNSYTSNVPNHENVILQTELAGDNIATIGSIELAYTPRQYYRIDDYQKRLLNSKYPTFTLNYEKGIPDLWNSQSDFDQVTFSISQSFSYRLINRIHYQLTTGSFLNNKQVNFADYQAFSNRPAHLMLDNSTNAFKLLDYTAFNSNESYFSAHLSVENNFLLLKHLPPFNKTELEEKVEFNYLLTEQKLPYYEFGYSLNRILLFMEAGIYTSFKDHQFESIGFKLGFNLNDF